MAIAPVLVITSDTEAVHCLVFIGLVWLEPGRGEVGVVGRVRPKLGFQAECAVAIVCRAGFANIRAVEPVAHVELNAGLVGIDFQRDARPVGDDGEDLFPECTRLVCDDEVVVEGDWQLGIAVDFLECPSFREVERRVFDWERHACCREIFVNLGMSCGDRPDLVVLAFVCVFAIEVEVGMVCKVDDGCLVCICGIVDFDFVVVRDAIDDLDVEFSWESRIAVRAFQRQFQCLPIDLRCVPEPSSVALPAVQGMLPFPSLISGCMFFHQDRFSAGDPVILFRLARRESKQVRIARSCIRGRRPRGFRSCPSLDRDYWFLPMSVICTWKPLLFEAKLRLPTLSL